VSCEYPPLLARYVVVVHRDRRRLHRAQQLPPCLEIHLIQEPSNAKFNWAFNDIASITDGLRDDTWVPSPPLYN